MIYARSWLARVAFSKYCITVFAAALSLGIPALALAATLVVTPNGPPNIIYTGAAASPPSTHPSYLEVCNASDTISYFYAELHDGQTSGAFSFNDTSWGNPINGGGSIRWNDDGAHVAGGGTFGESFTAYMLNSNVDFSTMTFHLNFFSSASAGDCSSAATPQISIPFNSATTVGPFINFVSPPADLEVLNDFGVWNLQYGNAASATAIRITYCLAGGFSTGPCDGSSPTSTDFTSAPPAPIINNLSFFKATALGGGVFSASVELLSGSSTIASTTISFQIANAPLGSGVMNSSTAQASCQNSDFGLIGNAVCNALVFLFYPSPQSLSQFGSIGHTITTKPPIGYYYIAQNAFYNISTSTATTTLVDASTTAAFSPIFTPTKAMITLGLWLLFGVWVIVRIRHMQI